MKALSFCFASLPALALVSSVNAAVYTVLVDAADYEAQDVNAISNGASGYLRVGTRTIDPSPTIVSAIFPFALPAIPANEQISSAYLSLVTVGQTSNLPVTNADLYGLPFDAAPVDQLASRYYTGADDTSTGVTKLQNDFLVPSSVSGTATRYDSADITSYVNSLYTAGAAAGDFAIFRLSADQPVATASNNRYQVYGYASTVAEANQARLVITTTLIPEPSAASLALLASASLIRRRRA